MALIRTLLIATLALAFCASAQADNSTRFGKYTVHYNAIPSSFIKPEVAEAHGLTRSRSVGLLNISVLENDPEHTGPDKGVSANIEGQLTNNIQQQRRLSFRRVQDGDAVYYLAQFQYSEGELLTFNIEASPHGQDRTFPIRFTKELYSD
ncbi:MAG: DUF4426 domain-containing protein [Halomonadaceae bacterium]|nr:MAG: DUF4426 domain-containing protein [Halomonadaceae bacterium]